MYVKSPACRAASSIAVSSRALCQTHRYDEHQALEEYAAMRRRARSVRPTKSPTKSSQASTFGVHGQRKSEPLAAVNRFCSCFISAVSILFGAWAVVVLF